MISRRKNTIVIMSDEHDGRILGCGGHPIVKTPNLDRLAANGTRFPNAYTPSPICVPARAAFATGMRVNKIRNWDNAAPYTGTPSSWGHVLQKHGVRCESIGKLHYRSEDDSVGFDKEHIPMHVVGGHGMVWASIRDPYIKRKREARMLGDYIGPGESPYTQYDRKVTEMAVNWLRDAGQREEPFVLYVGFVAPHFPLVAPQEFFDMYPISTLPVPRLHPSTGYVRHPWVQEYADFGSHDEKFYSAEERMMAMAAYYGLCSFLDSNIGQVLAAAESSGLLDTTQIIYTSDHGDNLGVRGLWGKSTLYQESVCIPMIVAGPAVPKGMVSTTAVDLLDIYPTILDCEGIDAVPHMEDRPGKSLIGMVDSSSDSLCERVVFSEYHASGSNTAGFMVRKGKWKYHYYVRYEPELFDLDSDPGETKNLAADPRHFEVLAEMEKELRKICDPEAVDELAKSDQKEMIAKLGGHQVASLLGSTVATPPPEQ